MRKPASIKLLIGMVAVLALIVSVSFAYFWPGGKTLKLSGEVQAKEIRNGSRFGGRVKRILVQEGQQVKEGDVLIEFDAIDLQAKIEDAEATLKQAQAQAQMVSHGADIGQIREAGSAVSQAQQHLKMVASGARPEEVQQAKAKVQAAEAQYKQAQQMYTNGKAMLDEGIISRQKYDSLGDTADTARASLDAARSALKMLQSGARPEERGIASAQLNAAKAQYGQVARGARPEEKSIALANVEKAQSALEALKAEQDEVRIKAPFSGTVSVIGVSEGELVQPGRPVITILDSNHLWTDVYVPESRLSLVKPGQHVSVRARSFKDAEFPGTVAVINPKSEFVPNSGGDSGTEEAMFRVKVSVGNRDANRGIVLYPGMKVDVLFNK